jgi:hypothetical protein
MVDAPEHQCSDKVVLHPLLFVRRDVHSAEVEGDLEEVRLTADHQKGKARRRRLCGLHLGC